ncbi:hypothetical protein KO489_03010 [Reinekea forsetii]|nr:hypothetical protein [Reinekea forsetii]
MKPNLKKISTIVAAANDQFDANNSRIDTVLGMIDSGLRKQGIQADAITVDCIPLDKKIVFLLHDQKPDKVTIALGNKAGDIHTSKDHPIEDVTVEHVLKVMQETLLDSESP